jgi:antitoxin VapB
VVTTKIFKNNTTQAVRLPRGVAFPDDVREVEIVVVGEARVITPKGARFDYWFDHGLRVAEDFMSERDQPAPQERESL